MKLTLAMLMCVNGNLLRILKVCEQVATIAGIKKGEG